MCFQVYNDSIFDLLDESMPALAGRTSLRLKEDAAGRIFVAGLSEVGSNPMFVEIAEPIDQASKYGWRVVCNTAQTLTLAPSTNQLDTQDAKHLYLRVLVSANRVYSI